jgi:hypothetical protein
MQAAGARLKSVYVTYQSVPSSTRKSGNHAYLRRVIAARSPGDLYTELRHGHASLHWSNDPLARCAYVTSGKLYNYFPANRVYSEFALAPEEALPGTLQNLFYFRAVALWPLAGRPRPTLYDRPICLDDVARDDAYTTLRPELELVDGRWCHVLEREDGVDRLWLDAARGCALCAREMDVAAGGPVSFRIELGGHREAAPGVWLPWWIRNIQYNADPGRTSSSHETLVDTRIEVVDCQANQVADSFFRFEPPPGALLVDSSRGQVTTTTQTHPGGVDHLDATAAWIRRHAAPAAQRSARGSGIAARGLLLAALVIAVLELSRATWTRREGLRRWAFHRQSRTGRGP